MDFKQFEYVSAVAEEKSISKAARKLFISQPSLSQYINRIESDLGVILFDRSTSPLNLTYEGRIYLETAEHILLLVEQMKKTFADVADLNVGKLTLGITSSKACHPLPSIFPVFQKKYPGIEILLYEGSSAELEAQMLKGAVDLCLLNLPFNSDNIAYEYINSERILLAAPSSFKPNKKLKNLPGSDLPHINIKDIADEHFILLKSDQRIRQVANKLFDAEKIKPKIVLETRSIESALRLVSAGAGFSFIPEESALYSGLVSVPRYFTIGHPPLSWDFVVAYKQDSYLSKSAKAFIEITKELLSSMYHDQHDYI